MIDGRVNFGIYFASFELLLCDSTLNCKKKQRDEPPSNMRNEMNQNSLSDGFPFPLNETTCRYGVRKKQSEGSTEIL